jgi:hypothetical protein
MALGLLRSPRLELLWSINTKASRDGSSSKVVLGRERFLCRAGFSLFPLPLLIADTVRLAVIE